jgi:hypothetical protein
VQALSILHRKWQRIMNRKYLLALLIAVVAGKLPSAAQSTAIASVAASIVAPISMAKTVDMNFGNAASSATAGGSITLSPDGARIAGGAGVTLPATAGTISAASFVVSGAPGFTYAITLPASALLHGPGSASLLVDAFTSSPAATGTLSATGNQTLLVGATLNISAAQTPGIYTNATAVPVIVNYN